MILKNFKLKSVGLFLINDYISVLTFDHFKRKYNTEFEIIFLNSIAHYQHNYWGKLSEKENKFFFNIIDQIIKILIKKENKFLIANGFSQYKNLKDDYIIYRQKDPKKFLKKLNISFKSINQNMTNETLINFVNIIKLNDAFNKLGKIYVDGKKFLNIEKNENKLNIFIKINFHKLIKNDKIKVKDNTIYLNKYLYPIRRTGSHSDEGIIITNLDSKINRIYNHDIHRLICEYFVIN